MSSVNISNMKNVKNMVKYVEVNKLSKWDINPRIISEQALNDLKYKITKYPLFMEARPILVNVDKTNQLIENSKNEEQKNFHLVLIYHCMQAQQYYHH